MASNLSEVMVHMSASIVGGVWCSPVLFIGQCWCMFMYAGAHICEYAYMCMYGYVDAYVIPLPNIHYRDISLKKDMFMSVSSYTHFKSG